MNAFKIITAAITAATLTVAAAGTSFAGQGCGRAQGAHGNGGAVNFGHSSSQAGYGQPAGYQNASSPVFSGQGVVTQGYANTVATVDEADADNEGEAEAEDEDDDDEFGDDVADGDEFDDEDDDDDADDDDEDDA